MVNIKEIVMRVLKRPVDLPIPIEIRKRLKVNPADRPKHRSMMVHEFSGYLSEDEIDRDLHRPSLF